jgi:hypothetical protein
MGGTIIIEGKEVKRYIRVNGVHEARRALDDVQARAMVFVLSMPSRIARPLRI